jgi:RimJ/RimL family protein N-acetyltransferase
MSLPMLQTARLLLRPLQEDDAEGLHTAYGDADAMRFFGTPRPTETRRLRQRAELIRGVLLICRVR